MKTPPRILMAIVGVLATLAMNAQAQTTWTGPEGGSLTTAGNWSNGLPNSAANPGTINAGAVINFNSSITGYFVTQDGGDVTTTTFRQFNSGSWTMNGGTMTVPSNFQLTTANDTHQDFTITDGTLALASPMVSSTGTGRTATMNVSGGSVSHTATWTVNQGGTVNFGGGLIAPSSASTALSVGAGGVFAMSGGTWNGSAGGTVAISGTLHISGGTFSTASNRTLSTNAGGTTIISGGTVSIGFSLDNSISGAGSYLITGGTVTAINNIKCASGFLLTLGGNTVGSLTAAGWHSTATYRKVDWLPGSKMTMTLTGVDDWAETEWAAGRMTYNGQGVGTLGNWAAVTAPGGLGDNTHFAYDGDSRTLSLATAPGGTVITVR